ncbi:MAG: hypothetical protein PVH88_24560 [Ignavibacteria bacterium]|jgi:hypothetical protein
MLIKKFSSYSIFVTILLHLACSSTTTMDDFFGIKMDPLLSDQFKIVSYDEILGAKYYSSREMNTNIYAYADFTVKVIEIKVVNESQNSIPLNYITDTFKIITNKGDQLQLVKDKSKYPSKDKIEPGESVTFFLKLPEKFSPKLTTVNDEQYDSRNLQFDKHSYDSWYSGGAIEIIKNKTKEIHVCLAAKTNIVLKPIPQKEKK